MESFSKLLQFKSTKTRILLIGCLGVIGAFVAVMVLVATRQEPQQRRLVTEITLGQYKNALISYKSDCGRFPDDYHGLQALLENVDECPAWKGPYIQKLPRDGWDREILYIAPLDSADVFSYGADGKIGGEGDNEDVFADFGPPPESAE